MHSGIVDLCTLIYDICRTVQYTQQMQKGSDSA